MPQTLNDRRKTMNAKQKLEFYKSKIGQHGVKDWREVAKTSHYWSKSLARKSYIFNPQIDGTKKRWIENTDVLRFVGYSDEIVSLRNNGWFADSFQDEVYRGAVWQLPARKGKSVYVYGYKDDNNPGSAIIDFDHTDEKKDAALRADSMAEYDAENSREYEAKDAAEQQISELQEEIADNKQEIKRLLAERRELKKQGLYNQTVCDLFAEKVKSLISDNQERKEKIGKLTDNYWLAVE